MLLFLVLAALLKKNPFKKQIIFVWSKTRFKSIHVCLQILLSSDNFDNCLYTSNN